MCIQVSSKTKHVVHYNVKCGDIIIWEFATKKRDIGFGEGRDTCLHAYTDRAVVNPRRACAARVMVLGLCVCVCVCRSILAPRAITRQTRDTSDFSVTWAAN